MVTRAQHISIEGKAPLEANLPITLRTTAQKELPLFLVLDRSRYTFAKKLFTLGHNTYLEVEKQEIYPLHCQEAALNAARTPEETAKVLKVNEMLLDMRYVHNIGDDLDRTVKNVLLERPTLKTGLAMLNRYNYAFTECDKIGGVARDLKKVLKKVQDIVEQKTGVREPFGAMLPSYLVVPFEGSKLDYGTWGRVAVVHGDVKTDNINLSLSLLEVNRVQRFLVNDKKESGLWPTDVTENVQNIVSRSGLAEGYAIVTTLHTTVGINKMNPDLIKKLHQDLLEIAPDVSSMYYHNILLRRGELKLRSNGKPFGDGNGQSHVWASLIGSYTIVPFRNGILSLEDGDRIIHHDVDKLPPRERGVAVTLIEDKHETN